MKRNYLKGFVWVHLLAALLISCPAAVAQAVWLPYGSGKLNGTLAWLKWDDILPANGLVAGQSITRTIPFGDMIVTVVIDEISFSGAVEAPGTIATTKLIGYNTGSKATDGLQTLYSYHPLYNEDPPICLAPRFAGAGSGLKVNFRVTAHAVLHGQAMDLNMFFASNEDGNEVAGAIDDYTQATTNGSAWKLLTQVDWELAHGSDLAKAVFTNANKTVRAHVGGQNSAVFQTMKPAASAASPLQANMEMNCGSASSVALGFTVYYDTGDGDPSYGMAINKLPFSIQGGDPVGSTATITNYFNWNTSSPGTPRISPGTVPEAFFSKLRVGPYGGDADSFGPTYGGFADEYNGYDEGIWPVNIEEVSVFPIDVASTFSYEVPAFKKSTNPATPAYVMAWIDFNQDGIFSASEYAGNTLSPDNSQQNLSFTWNLTNIPYGAGETYTRVRISYTEPASLTDDPATLLDERSIAILGEGETEDHRIWLTKADMITGKVYNDANGLTDSSIGGNGTNGGNLKVIAVGSNGKVWAFAEVDAAGNFSLPNVYNGTYELRLTTANAYLTQVAGSPLLAQGWVAAGEGSGISGDGTADANIVGIVVTLGTPVTDINFGINRRPVTDNKTFLVADGDLTSSPAGGPGLSGYRGIPLNSASLTGYASGGSPAGSDAEDCAAAGTCNAGKTFVIESIKPNSKLYYNNQEILPGNMNATIGNLDASKLVLYAQVGTGGPGDPVGFTYSLQDAAGVKSATPGTFSIAANAPFPVKLIDFTAKTVEHEVQLAWSTSEETASSHFEIQHSTDSRNWAPLGTVTSHQNSVVTKHYDFVHLNVGAGTHFYRLKMVDLDGSFTFSTIRSVGATTGDFKLYPNPADAFVHISGREGDEVRVYDLSGRLRLKTRVSNGQIGLAGLESGTYLITTGEKTPKNAGEKLVIVR
ncbi:Por secretion system C-terminal sorting domain-containing protein [Dyadobacter soli]|uniref:Por secretion system C-terminal sorting domain-containing protein n=1 Tax=Dyadobacter soli TaxID=659014 RepID=A0A1G7LQ52_9BACT|nr:CshA/CshB family fibrillar adhesin-related protein [Dyadobacter soli]SDF51625.1 Por secretion system C-terminal sorting domain-containing protein [Dyadobacter soli]